MTKIVTFEDAKAMLLELAQEFPDRFVRQCTYVTPTGEPNCLIGVALARWGVPSSTLQDLGTSSITKAVRGVMSYVTFTEDAVELLGVAQNFQDFPVDTDDYEPGFTPHLPWGEAIKRAFAQMEVMNSDGSGL